MSYLEKEENNSFNGDYPFFNDEDMELAYKVFSLREIALIQLGELELIACGKKEDFNYRPQIRKGLLYEIKKDFYNAYKCYENICSCMANSNFALWNFLELKNIYFQPTVG